MANFECQLYARFSIIMSYGTLNSEQSWEGRLAIPVLQIEGTEAEKVIFLWSYTKGWNWDLGIFTLLPNVLGNCLNHSGLNPVCKTCA